MNTGSVLVVDDEESVVVTIEAILRLDGHEVTSVTRGADALRAIAEHDFDVVLTDLRLDDVDGIDILRALQRDRPESVAVMLTGYASLDSAIAALRAGAYDYLVKPSDVEELRATIGRAMERRRLRQRLVELEELDRLKSQFVSMASHELRTPLTSVRGFLQVALRRVERQMKLAEPPSTWHEDGAKLTETLATAERQTVKLARLVDELLDVSRMQIGRLELRLDRVDLSEVAHDVAKRMQMLTTAHRVEVSTPAAVFVSADRDRLEQVLENLIANAIKYSPQGGRIDVTVTADDHARVSVRDEGIGIEPAQLERIYEVFYRSPDPAAGQVSGLGLGLYISREVVTRHGGRLYAESTPGRGSTFHVTLPLLERGRHAVEAAPGRARAS